MHLRKVIQNDKKINISYKMVIDNIKNDINKTKLDIMINANVNLINLYYRIGKMLYDNSNHEIIL